MNTLKYANRARNIKNNAQINEDQEGNAAFEIMQLKKQVAALKTEILQLRGLGMRRMEMAGAGAVIGTPKRPGDGDELNRLRVQIRDIQRRYDGVQKEKIAIEAERDFYKSSSSCKSGSPKQQIGIIAEHLKTITDLKNKVAELESGTGERRRMGPASRSKNSNGNSRGSITTMVSSPISVEAPSWFGKANDLIDRTRYEIRNNEAFIENLRSPGNDPDSGSAVMVTPPTKELTALLNDQTLKEELIVTLENSQQEYMVMRRKYEERLRLLQENIQTVQKGTGSSPQVHSTAICC